MSEGGDVDEEAKRELISVIDALSAEDRAFIANLREGGLYRLHHGLGTYIRNQFRQGGLPALFRWSRSQLSVVNHFDDLSGPILREIWRVLRTSSESTGSGT